MQCQMLALFWSIVLSEYYGYSFARKETIKDIPSTFLNIAKILTKVIKYIFKKEQKKHD